MAPPSTAAATAAATGLGNDHSLVTGDLGVVELLLAAGAALDDPGMVEEGRRYALDVLDDIGRHQPRCGHPHGIEAPGLLFGLAGIGYGLLRAEDPGSVPSVLTPGLG